jgi:heptaprenyl diphosphate synthase
MRLSELERFIAEVLERSPHIVRACRTLVERGKRLRACLLFASSHDRDFDRDRAGRIVRGAAVIELVHAASLMHDDIVDGCEVRRGLPVLHRSIGERGASLSGFYVVQHALALIADLPADARRKIGDVGRQLSRGQLTETLRAFDTSMLPDERLAIMIDKTAAVFGLACELGGLLSGQDPECSVQLREFGTALGMLFQVADDVDDIFASARDLGRPAGSDLGNGVVTLPVIFVMQTCARNDIVRLVDPSTTIDSHDRLSRCQMIIHASGALEQTHEIALGYAKNAQDYLQRVPASETTQWMDSLVNATLARVTRYADAADAQRL